MGCDIHVMVEVARKGRWINADNWRINPYHGEFEDARELELKPIYTSRNYELFSFLAGVRNYGDNPSFGFDRGFPADASKHTTAEYESWGDDAHTPGYATLAELKEKAATVATVKRKGYVLKEQIERFKETGETPSEWAQGVGGRFADRFAWFEWEDEVHCFDRLIAAIDERKRDVFHIFRPEEDDGARDGEIRIVFWFDN